MTKDDLIEIMINAQDSEGELSTVLNSALSGALLGADIEQQVDFALDWIDKIGMDLQRIHDYYRSADEWEGERWR